MWFVCTKKMMAFSGSIQISVLSMLKFAVLAAWLSHLLPPLASMNIGAVPPGQKPQYGKLLAPGLYAPNHQHFFCFRIDPMIDGINNSVVEEHTESVDVETPYGNAFIVKNSVLRTELEARQRVDSSSARSWRIINPSVL